jgi:hypothetical protein
MTCWGGDLDCVALAVQPATSNFDLPARHLAGIVAAFALPATVGIDGQATIGVALDVVDVANRRITEWVAASPIPPHDQLPDVAVEVAAVRIPTNQRPPTGAAYSRRHHNRPLLVASRSRARSISMIPLIVVESFRWKASYIINAALFHDFRTFSRIVAGTAAETSGRLFQNS